MVQGFAYLFLILAGLSRAAALAWPTAAWVPPSLAYGEPSWILSAVGMCLAYWGLRMTAASRVSWRHYWLRAGLYLWVALLATWYWVTYSMHVFGGLPSFVAWGAAALLALFLAVQAGLMLGLAAYAMQGRRAIFSAILFAAGWLLHEWVLTSWWTGFPWGETALPWIDVAPHWPAWLGSGVAGALAAGLCAGLMAVWMPPRVRPWARALPVGLGLLAIWPFGNTRHIDVTHPGSVTSVALLQTQIRQDVKFDEAEGLKPLLTWVAQSLRQVDSEVVVWPETAIPLMSNDPRVAVLHAQAVSRMPKQQAWVVGLPWVESKTESYGNAEGQTHANPLLASSAYYNAVQWWHVGQSTPEKAPAYAKSHLVPFGEFVPPGFRWFVNAMRIPMSDFSRGGLAQPAVEWAGQRWASTICYEDLFGMELARRMVAMPKPPTVWINHSNLAWFGPGVAPFQHVQMARWRAAELGRPMVRATNTGMTAVIDHQGRVVDRLDPRSRAVLVSSVHGREGLTPYVRWVNLPWVWEGLLTLAALLVAWGIGRKKS